MKPYGTIIDKKGNVIEIKHPTKADGTIVMPISETKTGKIGRGVGFGKTDGNIVRK